MAVLPAESETSRSCGPAHPGPVLVVGTDRYERMMLRSLFEASGLEVHEAGTVGQAVRMFLYGPDVAAVVVSGDAATISLLAHWTRHWLGLDDLPLVCLTLRGQPIPLLCRGANVMLEKPLDLGSLRRKVTGLVATDSSNPAPAAVIPGAPKPAASRLPPEAVQRVLVG